MINTESNGNGIFLSGAGSPAVDKQPSSTLKKMVLRDVQNENVGSIHKNQESLLFGGGKPSGDAIKARGTKRLTPERLSNSSLAFNGTNDNIMNTHRRLELELGRGRFLNNEGKYSGCPKSTNLCPLPPPLEISKKQTLMRESNIRRAPVATSNHMTPVMVFSSVGPSVPSSLGKHGNNTQAPGSDCLSVSSELPHVVDSKDNSDQLRTERFIRLQNFLRQCDEANQMDRIQMLLHLSPLELSKHAVELEKRAIQLTIDEGKEMQRLKALNVLAKSCPTKVPSQSNHSLHSNKDKS
ncbi:unnamed protein product [Fraxinus pennsylvanica]|uniref:Uncharacterized protein n=1 Tax=Fraxinus pennsylvanica TaxID=56036 RepID=A0AAD1YV41_9LAMI|nr:unnamed protein product [Fraxinus pennsylvanica]